MATTTLLDLTIAITPPLLTLLRLTPLLSTTASLTHAYMELVTTSSFLNPAPTTSSLSHLMLNGLEPASTPTPEAMKELKHAKELASPAWFVSFFNRGVYSVIGLNTLTLLSASGNLWLFPNRLGASRPYYLVGLVAALGHYAFVPRVAPSIEQLFRLCAAQEKGEDSSGIEEGGKGKGAVENIREWVSVHKLRMGSVDLVAWVSFGFGVVEALTR